MKMRDADADIADGRHMEVDLVEQWKFGNGRVVEGEWTDSDWCLGREPFYCRTIFML